MVKELRIYVCVCGPAPHLSWVIIWVLCLVDCWREAKPIAVAAVTWSWEVLVDTGTDTECTWLAQHWGSSWALEIPGAICRITVTVTRGSVWPGYCVAASERYFRSWNWSSLLFKNRLFLSAKLILPLKEGKKNGWSGWSEKYQDKYFGA